MPGAMTTRSAFVSPAHNSPATMSVAEAVPPSMDDSRRPGPSGLAKLGAVGEFRHQFVTHG